MAQILAYVTSLFQVLLIFIESTLDKALKYNAHKYPHWMEFGTVLNIWLADNLCC